MNDTGQQRRESEKRDPPTGISARNDHQSSDQGRVALSRGSSLFRWRNRIAVVVIGLAVPAGMPACSDESVSLEEEGYSDRSGTEDTFDASLQPIGQIPADAAGASDASAGDGEPPQDSDARNQEGDGLSDGNGDGDDPDADEDDGEKHEDAEEEDGDDDEEDGAEGQDARSKLPDGRGSSGREDAVQLIDPNPGVELPDFNFDCSEWNFAKLKPEKIVFQGPEGVKYGLREGEISNGEVQPLKNQQLFSKGVMDEIQSEFGKTAAVHVVLIDIGILDAKVIAKVAESCGTGHAEFYVFQVPAKNVGNSDKDVNQWVQTILGSVIKGNKVEYVAAIAQYGAVVHNEPSGLSGESVYSVNATEPTYLIFVTPTPNPELTKEAPCADLEKPAGCP